MSGPRSYAVSFKNRMNDFYVSNVLTDTNFKATMYCQDAHCIEPLFRQTALYACANFIVSRYPAKNRTAIVTIFWKNLRLLC